MIADNDTVAESVQADEAPKNIDDNENNIEPLVTLASALLDLDRLRITALLSSGPANRMTLSEATGLSHRDLLRNLDSLQTSGLVRLRAPVPREPDAYSPYELNAAAFSAARKAMGKYKGVRKRPSDSREMTLETFMPDGKLRAMPFKQSQIVVILEELARRFEPEKQYTEREVNVILEEINEDYCLTRRSLVDYGYLSRKNGVYTKNA